MEGRRLRHAARTLWLQGLRNMSLAIISASADAEHLYQEL